MKFGVKKLEASLYRTMRNFFRYLEPRGTGRRTDRQTERPLAIALPNTSNAKCLS